MEKSPELDTLVLPPPRALTSSACPLVEVASSAAVDPTSSVARGFTLAECIATIQERLAIEGPNTQQPSSVADFYDTESPAIMSTSPNDIPTSPTQSPPPLNFGLAMGGDCNIPIVEIMNIDSVLPVNMPRAETPTS